MKVTVLGLGQMGAVIAATLVKAGYETTVWNRSPGKEVEGTRHAVSAREAVDASPLVLAVVSDHETVRQVSAGSRALINLATGTPEEAKESAEWAARNGIDYLDGAMLAVPGNLATPEAHFLYSGSKAVFEDNQKMLDLLATNHFLSEDPTVTALWDAALLGVGYSTLLGFLHSAALLDTVGTAPSQLIPLIEHWMKGMLGFIGELSGEIEAGDYRGGVSPLAMNRTAVGNLVGISLSRGVNAEPLLPLRALLDRGVANGNAELSVSSLFELLRSEAGRPARER